jgi:molybdopterin synthase catalytic subunit
MSRFAIVDEPIVPEELLAAVGDRGAGASVLFLGTTRNVNVGRRVVKLEYEAYGRMAVREMRALAAEARTRWPLRKVAMVHRIGVVPVGEASVGIAVSGGHRTETFEACHWLIDRLKEIVPIWKKEHFRGGTVWIGAQQGGPEPTPRRARTTASTRKRRRG